MNKTEHLLACLIEECSEIQKDSCKALRFGLNDINPRTQVKNRNAIAFEINDLLAVIELLEESEILEAFIIGDRIKIDEKKAKVMHYMKYAEQQGALVSFKKEK